jgi:D-sedoheptulose 7-phosphate isomerase
MSYLLKSTPIFEQIFEHAIADHLSIIESLRAERPILERTAIEMTHIVLAGNKILLCGNGGSATDSQHLAAGFVGRFRRERRGLPSVALTTDTPALTSISNDYVTRMCAAGKLRRYVPEGIC